MRGKSIVHVVALALLCGWLAAGARAQGPDVRGTKPLMMLVVDSSGSMEYLPNCACTTDNCHECWPMCDSVSETYQKSRWATALEALTGSWPADANNLPTFRCETYERNNSDKFGYDYGYQPPYHQPWECSPAMSGPCNNTATQDENGILDSFLTSVRFGLMTFDGQPTYLGAEPLVAKEVFNRLKSESEDGLWSYGMGESTPLSPRVREDGSEVGLFHFPNCDNDFLIDTGGRNQTALQGALISAVSLDSMESTNQSIQNALLKTRPYGGTPMAAAMDDLYFYFKELEDEYSNCRDTFAVLMTDGKPDDDYRLTSGCDCKDRLECCEVYNNVVSCEGMADLETNPNYSPALYQCPYPTPEEVADALINGYDGSGGVIKECYVVGFATPCNDTDPDLLDPPYDPAHDTEGCQVRDRLNAIARKCKKDPTGEETAIFADNLEQLRQKINGILSQVSTGAVSRTTPAFLDFAQGQYQFNSGFTVGSESQAWSGVLERRRFICVNGSLDSPNLSAAAGDLFHVALNANVNRKLWTVLPTNPEATCGGLPCTPKDHLYRYSSGAPCGPERDSYCGGVKFSNPTDPNSESDDPIKRTHLEIAEPDPYLALLRRMEIMNWVHGATPSRVNHKLGDIYHSSPEAVGRPTAHLADDEYSQFRYQKLAVRKRPLALYVGSNDGILHAFSVEDASTDNVHGISYTAGKEMWGFIPPILLHKLGTASDMHTFMVDGTPVVKDLFLSRVPGRASCSDASGNLDDFCNYRTVLVTGLRGGGSAYVALDVTDPIWDPDGATDGGTDEPSPGPRFLWQFTHPDLGLTYGKPALGQVMIKWNPTTNAPDSSGNGVLMERAVAILPGGVGVEELVGTPPTSHECDALKDDGQNNFYSLSPSDASTDFYWHRPLVKCWQTTNVRHGRSVFIVDVETGKLIKQIDETIFPSPVVGTPALYRGDVAALATRAFVADADGVLWRIELSTEDGDPKPSLPLEGWTARPFHDLYWWHKAGDGYKMGQPSYEAPVLSVDDAGRVVVLFATGDTENFENTTAQNYVVSLTESLGGVGEFPSPNDIKGVLNWEIALLPSELVTGGLELFNKRAYFASFMVRPSDDPCDFGYSRLFAVDYTKPSDNVSITEPPTYRPAKITTGLGDLARLFNNEPPDIDPELFNKLYMGIGLTRRPQCFATGSVDPDDPYGQLGGLASAVTSGGADFKLVAMASGETQVGGSALGSKEIWQDAPPQLNSIQAYSGTCE